MESQKLKFIYEAKIYVLKITYGIENAKLRLKNLRKPKVFMKLLNDIFGGR